LINDENFATFEIAFDEDKEYDSLTSFSAQKR
jgi:hypothetical protein